MHVPQSGDEDAGGDGAEGGAGPTGLEGEAVYSGKNDVRLSLVYSLPKLARMLTYVPSPFPQVIPPETIRAIALVSAIILLLARHNVPIHPTTVAEAYDLALESDLDAGKLVPGGGVGGDEVGEGLMMALRAGRMV